MIFSELYSAYYNAVADILKAATDHPLQKNELRLIIEKSAFGESVINIESAFSQERWQLLRRDGTTNLQNQPSMPLTTLQKILNASMNVRQYRTLFFISLVVAVASMLAVFALTLLLSKRAISPYMKNLEMQKQFITNASHEIKTPLTSIATSADVLAMDQENNEWIVNIQKQTVRLSKLVSNLVTLSRLNEETPFPDKSDFSLSDALWETAEPFATLANGKEKSYTQNIENGLRLVGDRAAIQQTVSILLDNAVKYSSVGGEIRLTAKRKGKKIQI